MGRKVINNAVNAPFDPPFFPWRGRGNPLQCIEMSNLVEMTIRGSIMVPLAGEGNALNLSTITISMSKYM